MQVFIEDDLGCPEEVRAIGLRPQRNPVVGAVGRRVVLRGDDDDAGAALDGLELPVRFRHLVLDEVLAPAGVQLGEAHVGEVHVAVLGPVPERMGRILVAVPGVVGIVLSALRLFGVHFPNPGVEQRQTSAVEPGVHHLADDAEDRHTCAMLERPDARALHHFDHFRRIALLPEPTGSGFAAVARRDQHGALGDIGEGRIPRDPVEVV